MVDNALVVQPSAIPSAEAFGVPTLWGMACFSQSWLRDAYGESQLEGPDPRRREVLFSVCFAETYLLEWVRDQVLRHDLSALNNYFPPDTRRGIREKFKTVTQQLHKDKRTAGYPDFSGRLWADFVELVGIRDGLIHASISRPDNPRLAESEKPQPSPAAFYELTAGSGLRPTLALLLATHDAAGIAAPGWLVNPGILPR